MKALVNLNAVHAEIVHDSVYTGGADTLTVGRSVFRQEIAVIVIEDGGQICSIHRWRRIPAVSTR